MKTIRVNLKGEVKTTELVENVEEMKKILKNAYKESYDELDVEYAEAMFEQKEENEVVAYEGIRALSNGKEYPLLVKYAKEQLL